MASRKLARPDLPGSVSFALGHGGEPKLWNVNLAHGPEVISQDVNVHDHLSVLGA